MVLVPMARNRHALADPHTLSVARDMLQESRQSRDSSRMSDHPRMQPDRHHFGARRAFTIQPVEGVPMPGLVVGTRGKRPRCVLRIVVRVRVWHRQVLLPADVDPIGKLVVINVAVIEESAGLDEQTARIDAGSGTAAPPHGSPADFVG